MLFFSLFLVRYILGHCVYELAFQIQGGVPLEKAGITVGCYRSIVKTDKRNAFGQRGQCLQRDIPIIREDKFIKRHRSKLFCRAPHDSEKFIIYPHQTVFLIIQNTEHDKGLVEKSIDGLFGPLALRDVADGSE